jgi:purine-binding chemotaxis protein CheW
VYSLLEFTIGPTRYAVAAERVVEVVPRVWLTPLPGAAPIVVGVFNYRGDAIVAVDLRARFGLAPRAPAADDHLVVVRGARRVLALIVDRVTDLRAVSMSAVQPTAVPARYVTGVVPLDDGLLLLHDLDAVLSLDEEGTVDAALAAAVDP